jgi:hypothetical protein
LLERVTLTGVYGGMFIRASGNSRIAIGLSEQGQTETNDDTDSTGSASGVPRVAYGIHGSARRNRGKYWNEGELLMRDTGERQSRSSHGPVGEPRGLGKLGSRRERLLNGTMIPITRVTTHRLSADLSMSGLRGVVCGVCR